MMKANLYFFSLLTLSVYLQACGGNSDSQTETNEEPANQEEISDKTYSTTGSIERLAPELDQIISSEAKLEILAEGMTWAEGPLWIADKNWLLFTDVPENKIYRWTEENGLEVYLEPSGFTGDATDSREEGANGLTLDAEGYLVLCQHGNRQVARMKSPLDDPKPNFESLTAEYQGKRFNSPNDLVFDSKGNLYFTDPPYGLGPKMMDDPKKELPYQGVFYAPRRWRTSTSDRSIDSS